MHAAYEDEDEDCSSANIRGLPCAASCICMAWSSPKRRELGAARGRGWRVSHSLPRLPSLRACARAQQVSRHGVADRATRPARVTWRGRRHGAPAPVQSPWTGTGSAGPACSPRLPAAGSGSACVADPTWSTRRCAAASATPRARAVVI